jgi:hypothetical protein
MQIIHINRFLVSHIYTDNPVRSLSSCIPLPVSHIPCHHGVMSLLYSENDGTKQPSPDSTAALTPSLDAALGHPDDRVWLPLGRTSHGSPTPTSPTEATASWMKFDSNDSSHAGSTHRQLDIGIPHRFHVVVDSIRPIRLMYVSRTFLLSFP